MEFSINKLKHKVKCLVALLRHKIPKRDVNILEDFANSKLNTKADVKNLIQFLTQRLLEDVYTKPIAIAFEDYLLLLLTNALDDTNQNIINGNHMNYQRICIALSKLMHLSLQAKRYAIKYFTDKPAPFFNISHNQEPKVTKRCKTTTVQMDASNIIKCCYLLLKCDVTYFKNLWNWSEFIEEYMNKEISPLDQFYVNHIIALLTNMNPGQLQQLNAQIPPQVLIDFDKEMCNLLDKPHLDNYQNGENAEQMITVAINNKSVTNIEGVLFPIFNQDNYEFYANTDGSHDNIVKVDSTKVNLRSIALGIANGKAICLSGPVGCGKTTLIEYLARKTGRICPKLCEIENERKLTNGQQKNFPNKSGLKRKKVCDGEEEDVENITQSIPDNGFLRIQLGDQTDCNMLLGQYHCTDMTGEFIWLPGVLTQAVMNGYWLLLEDLDLATKDTFTILSSLLENNYLSVPGFRDSVKAAPGFQLFVTVRTIKSSSTNSNHKALFSLLEKYLYTINILPLSRNELCRVVSANYPKLKTIANRIVDVFLTFSSGDHAAADNLRQQESSDRADTTEHYVQLPHEHISVSALTTSGRLVSTRDLIKLCQRSNPTFSVTNMECANFVFRNAVDVFCSYLPHSGDKTKLITSIGAKLGIIESRCKHFAEDYTPEITINNEIVRVGRAELPAGEPSNNDLSLTDLLEQQATKRLKLNDDGIKLLPSSDCKKTSKTFSFTRIASCMLERIAICVKQAEPVLLVGETGVGKTSAVQFLAQRTKHKLVVVNMNNQSDVADLVGGFKPVDLSYIVFPLRCEFELLFRQMFNETKNQKLLKTFILLYNQGEYKTVVELMLQIIKKIFHKAEQGELNKFKDLLSRCRNLQMKLQKLYQQLEKSINISFAFIPGSLVNCIKYGDWVLLDELNLASAETLECLSTILEPGGSIVLLEKGDFTPVRRHPEFRLFACMNPSTDVGKKDLPIGIRNRFTEFYVDDITAEKDLCLLVSDYLKATGIREKPVLIIVRLYKRLKQLAKLELNDGLGNRPVYSLRTLCRALMICARNLCGSIERNLYESINLSFLTQLDAGSHNVVQKLIQDSLLSNVKAVLNQTLPKPGEDYLNFEGYWIQQGPRTIQECTNYILTESVRKNLKDLARIIGLGKLPILLQGPTSAGKTSLIEYIAKRSGNHCLRINNHEHTDLQEYVGTYTADVTGKLAFKEGVLVQAMRNGYWIILDELNLASTEILEALNRVLDDNRELFIPETQTVVKAHPNFMLFATQNPPGLYGGRKTLSRAFKNRFIELHFCDIPRPELEVILEKRCLIPASYARKMVACMSELQMNRKTTTKNVFTLRDLFRWGNRYTLADKKLLNDPQYDWNQHLVEEGYLVLSAKVRTQLEINIIQDALYKHFRKQVNPARLFHIANEQNDNSPVTRDIIAAICDYKERTDIVWTYNMTRMAVLTAKALQFDEPVLLVGPTGCGKTTVCQLLAAIKQVQLRILNCHMHTEAADFLGGLRPYRPTENVNEPKKSQLFEWSDGPLIYAMEEGSYFMADEISLAEDSVLERLNCILEPERTVLLAEKIGLIGNTDNDTVCQEFVVQASQGFQFLATMNPGGDYGKKELSPALRNRFTEIWCQPSDTREDLIRIASNCIQQQLESKEKSLSLATYIIDIVWYMQQVVEKFKYSIRDILSWAQYMINNNHLTFLEKSIYGLHTVFLDALELSSQESEEKIEALKTHIVQYSIKQAQVMSKENFSINDLKQLKDARVECTADGKFGIKPFFIPINSNDNPNTDDQGFLFDAPTTKTNLFRLLSALTLKKPILLEGPPGVGKTSIVESTAKAIGFHIVRINLCEHTDLADLFGTDLPSEDNILNESHSDNKTSQVAIGSFVWRDGPLLAALKAHNTWILLDELNLAPQSVLEGLNAILDHRGEVYIPELNKTFKLSQQTRIFACQNPLKQGGGRKGLPQSFLNRFTKVYLRKLNTPDLLHVINKRFEADFLALKDKFLKLLDTKQEREYPDRGNLFVLYYAKKNKGLSTRTVNEEGDQIIFDLALRMVQFSERLHHGLANMEFGYRGGPYEFNLRDLLRWCELLIHPKTGFSFKSQESFTKNFENFLLTLYERMKLVYYQRMRCEPDKLYIRSIFSEIFHCDADRLNVLSEDVSLYWTSDNIYLNDIVVTRNGDSFKSKENAPLLLRSQREILKNMIECIYMEKPILLCGPSDTGKTKLVDAICTLRHETYNTDTIDDSVTGSFQQIDLKRHLEEMAQVIESTYLKYIQNSLLACQRAQPITALELIKLWSSYSQLSTIKWDFQNTAISTEELKNFLNRLKQLQLVLRKLQSCYANETNTLQVLQTYENKLRLLENHIEKVNTLNTGGHFEWVDSKIVKCLKRGQYIALEHANLCSSAVLDRLNPVFEPQSCLMISEKGVTSQSAVAEMVFKHANFQAFLTIDPKNGELSRAMRNRCVELAVTKDCFDLDDKRAIVYSQGVHNVKAINCLISIHENVSQLSEINSYNISHLMQAAHLTHSYLTIDFETARAIYVSTMEIYVYSANVDLLGYGLNYYQNKLRDIVVGEIEKYNSSNQTRKERSNYLKDFILKSDNLNETVLITLQMLPLRIVIEQQPHNYKNCLLDISNRFEEFNMETIKPEDLKKHLLLTFYSISSFHDVELRYLKLEQLLTDNKDLQQLSKVLYNLIINFKEDFSLMNPQLPWNSKLYPRIRDYTTLDMTVMECKAFRLQALLIVHLLIPDIPQPTNSNNNLSRMDVLTYSQLLNKNLITDKFNNDFLKYYASFLSKLYNVLKTQPVNAEVTEESLVHLIIYLPWFKRLLHTSQNVILMNGVLNVDLVQKLLLHFKWLDKHLLHFCHQIMPMMNNDVKDLKESSQQLSNYVLSVKYPMNRMRKIYTKKILQFQPYYEEKQVKWFLLSQQMDELLNVIPNYGNYPATLIRKKLKAHNSDIVNCILRKMYKNISTLDLNLIPINLSSQQDVSLCLPLPIKNHIQQLVADLNDSLKQDNQPGEDDLYGIENDVKSLCEEFNKEQEQVESCNDADILISTLREWFLIRFCVATVNQIKDMPESLNLNPNYCENLATINSNTKHLLLTLDSPHYKHYMKLWMTLHDYVQSLEDVKEFENILLYLNGNYRNLNAFNSIIMNAVQNLQFRSLSLRTNILQSVKNDEDIISLSWYEGPSFINIIDNLIFQSDGQFKAIAVNEYELWKTKLQRISQLLWINASMVTPSHNNTFNNWHLAHNNAKRLVKEVNYVRTSSEGFEIDHFPDYTKGFENLLNMLKAVIQTESTTTNGPHKADAIKYQVFMFEYNMVNAIMGAIGLCLATFMPLVDPVEKNRLKNLYIKEDIQNVTTMMAASDFMRIIMNYKNLNVDFYHSLEDSLESLTAKELILKQKVALRPQKCFYAQLIKDIQHFLKTNCEPSMCYNLLQQIQKTYENLTSTTAAVTEKSMDLTEEVLKKMNLWLANAQRFLQHILQPYKGYYQDFVVPLKCSVQQLYSGLEGLKTVLFQMKNTFIQSSSTTVLININQEAQIYEILQNLIEFPRIHSLQIYEDVECSGNILKNRSKLLKIIQILPDSEHEYFRLIKSKLRELQNVVITEGLVTKKIFPEIDYTFKLINEIWKQEEEQRKQQKDQEDSLYINKTKCVEENEELLELQELEEIFPTSVQEDFGDFLQEESLENVMKLDKKKLLKTKNWAIIKESDYRLVVTTFMNLFQNYTKVEYNSLSPANVQKDLIDCYKEQVKVFVRLYHHYRLSVNDWLEEQTFNGLSFCVGLQQDILKQLTLKENLATNYNFYKDSNINEVMECCTVLGSIEKRVDEQLSLYPDHATLLDIKKVIERIRGLPCNAPVIRFNTGFQILRQKVSQWNEVAHRKNDLKAEELLVAEFVQKWMRLELQFWRNCLTETREKVECHAYKYWFFIYHLLQDYLQEQKINPSLYNIRYCEQRYAEQVEVNTEEGKEEKKKMSLGEVMKILRQFLESSSYGDFCVRLQLLKSFEMYLHHMGEQQMDKNKKLSKLISGLHNLHIYFYQFQEEIDEWNKSVKAPIEKKLKDLVKIESYNKDLSYFSMRNNVARVHRNLNKFLKEYQQLLQEKINKVLQYKDTTNKEYQLKVNAQPYDYQPNSAEFMAKEELKSYCLNSKMINVMPQTVWNKLPHLFMTSRNVVKDCITQGQYPKLLQSLDSTLEQHLEHCFHLSNLNVDRSKERPKQILEAKQILQQKRKALADFFKTLTTLGLHYKTGLMELSLNTEYEDFTITPFNLTLQPLPQQYLKCCENLNLYFAKSIFKLKLLQNIMLTPLSELGLPNIERLKGFSVDMFTLVQKQRRFLATSCNTLNQFKTIVKQLKSLKKVVMNREETNLENSLDFVQYRRTYEAVRSSCVKILYVMEQFQLLLKCQPSRESSENQMLSHSENVLVQGSNLANSVELLTDGILQITESLIQEMANPDNEFLDKPTLDYYLNKYKNAMDMIEGILKKLETPQQDYLPLAQPLLTLKAQIHDIFESQLSENCPQHENNYKEIRHGLENIVERVLLSLQKLYKTRNSVIKKEAETEEAEEVFVLQPNHLKEKLFKDLCNDWNTLDISSIAKKMSNILCYIRETPPSAEKLCHANELLTIYPILEQFCLMADYQLCQQVAAHKISVKMLSIMLSVFVEIASKGFCVPADLQQDEEGDPKQQQQQNSNSFGLGDDAGEKDASDKIESEDQLEDAKRPEDRKNDSEDQEQSNCKEEKGIDMSEDFEGKLQDVEKPENEEDDSGESEPEEELDKEMGKTEEGAEKLDDQIWGDDEEETNEDQPEDTEEDGTGNKNEKDEHNNLNAKNEAAKEDSKDEHQQNGLDAVNDPNDNRKQQQQNDIDDMKEPEFDEDQINPYHNELEDPPEAEDMDLGDMNNVDGDQDDMGEREEADENPFDIDKMKENMPPMEVDEEATDNNDDKIQNEDMNVDTESEDSDLEDGEEGKNNDDIKENKKEEESKMQDEDQQQTTTDAETQKGEELETQDDDKSEENKKDELNEMYEQSKDNPSHEDNIQSMPDNDTEQQSAADQVQAKNESDKNIQQEQKLDEQDTGEEKDGIGQAEDDKEDGGHQGIADTKETISDRERKNEKQTKEKRKQGHTNEERTLGEPELKKIKQLKTIDKLNKQTDHEANNADNEELDQEAEEYQHVKEPKKGDKITLDNATEEQSKKVKHLEDEDNNPDEQEDQEELMEEQIESNDDNTENLNEMDTEEVQAEKVDKKSEKPSKMEKTNERMETSEKLDVEGDVVETMTVPRNNDTTAHCNQEQLLDVAAPTHELSTDESVALRRLYQDQIGTCKPVLTGSEDHEAWQTISNRMTQNARELCEQLRLILEPTKCTRLKGDYRTGRRINMKKIIPYIASQFRKDKIWLRRTKPAQRDYKITIAIDDSKSMHHNNSKTLTLEAISLVSQALTLLESGRLSVLSFGETSTIILNHTEQFDGPKLINSLNFAQDKTKIADLLDFVRTISAEEGCSSTDNGIFENLLLVLSDGRNIFSEGKSRVRNAIKLARLQRIFLVYIIIDNPDNKNSILDIQTMEILPDKRISIKTYLDDFPFPYYVIVRDLNQLPLVLSEAMRQWFELVNSEQ